MTKDQKHQAALQRDLDALARLGSMFTVGAMLGLNKPPKPRKHWQSPPPATCDLCGDSITTEFVDGKVVFGPWGVLCPKCFPYHGVGLGTGRGQRYVKEADGVFYKVEG